MSFKVTQQFGSGRETVSQQFVNADDAKKHALTAAEEKKAMKIEAIYRVYDLYDDVIATYDTKTLTVATPTNNDDNASSGGKGQGASFRPTPLATAPRPSGTPPKWLVDDEEDKK